MMSQQAPEHPQQPGPATQQYELRIWATGVVDRSNEHEEQQP